MGIKNRRNNSTEITFDKGNDWFAYNKFNIRDKSIGLVHLYRYWNKYKKEYAKFDLYHLYYDMKVINSRNDKGDTVNNKNFGYKRYGII